MVQLFYRREERVQVHQQDGAPVPGGICQWCIVHADIVPERYQHERFVAQVVCKVSEKRQGAPGSGIPVTKRTSVRGPPESREDGVLPALRGVDSFRRS